MVSLLCRGTGGYGNRRDTRRPRIFRVAAHSVLRGADRHDLSRNRRGGRALLTHTSRGARVRVSGHAHVADGSRPVGASGRPESERLELPPYLADVRFDVLRRLGAIHEEIQVRSRLKVLRAEKGWSQGDLADRAGVSRQTINAIETEKYEPSLSLAFKLAAIFDLSIESVFQPDRDSDHQNT